MLGDHEVAQAGQLPMAWIKGFTKEKLPERMLGKESVAGRSE